MSRRTKARGMSTPTSSTLAQTLYSLPQSTPYLSPCIVPTCSLSTSSYPANLALPSSLSTILPTSSLFIPCTPNNARLTTNLHPFILPLPRPNPQLRLRRVVPPNLPCSQLLPPTTQIDKVRANKQQREDDKATDADTHAGADAFFWRLR
ncbi:uncharacterized protein EI97DRAFT_70965 [Westerdykella ornata]|uniref:Uncharacterized protein n=1 Tax=Westerdykella ornata TaxID=318751 RepID=A0A6A6JI34_WESOR|nr:uncharacterized protein EI97DRAFT_70965 [Westerdykella ornata]KAF2275743.1 hypothetical protein EI97DRAFT_70965 [Westerdykella ornata]